MSKTNRSLGVAGEKIAYDYLMQKKYLIVQKNFHTRYGEIDLIVTRQNYLYFVEVKRRLSHTYGEALLSISETKKKRLRKTAQYFLSHHIEFQKYIPFYSALLIDEKEQTTHIEFIENAFDD